jgi:uncharacterized protein YhbP (UPF0306 family)
MTVHDDPATIARAIVGSNLYLVLGTADEAGVPWASPVYYAHDGFTRFLWVSSPESQHSRNLAARPEVALVIFDSGAPISTGQAVYAAATAGEVGDDEVDDAIDVFSRRSLSHGGVAWSREDVRGTARLRLYRATASQQWILEPGAPTDRRIPIDLSG